MLQAKCVLKSHRRAVALSHGLTRQWGGNNYEKADNPVTSLFRIHNHKVHSIKPLTIPSTLYATDFLIRYDTSCLSITIPSILAPSHSHFQITISSLPVHLGSKQIYAPPVSGLHVASTAGNLSGCNIYILHIVSKIPIITSTIDAPACVEYRLSTYCAIFVLISITGCRPPCL